MTLVRAIATQAARVPEVRQKLDAETLTVKEGNHKAKREQELACWRELKLVVENKVKIILD